MKNILLYAVACIVFLCTTTKNATAQTETEMKAWMDYMTPGDMHKLLAAYDGDWNVEGKMWMDPKQQPMTSAGTATYKMVMGGRYQESEYKGNVMGQPMEGFGLLGYDNLKKVFESTWVDNMGTGTMRSEGKYDPATKTFTFTGNMVDPMSGKTCTIRQTEQMVDNDTHVMTMYNSIGGAAEFKTMELTFKRKK